MTDELASTTGTETDEPDTESADVVADGEDLEVVEAEALEVEDDEETSVPTRPLEERREDTRRFLALLLVWTFAATIAATFIATFFAQGDADWEKVRSILELMLPAEMALTGSALGFYFGSRSSSD